MSYNVTFKVDKRFSIKKLRTADRKLLIFIKEHYLARKVSTLLDICCKFVLMKKRFIIEIFVSFKKAFE